MSIFEIYCKIASSMNSQIVEIKEKLITELTPISSSKDFPFLFLGFIKHELKELSSTKEVEFLEILSNVETNSIDPKTIDKNNLTKEKYIELENDLLVLLDLFFEIDLERKEFNTSRQLAVLKAKFLSPLIETNFDLMIDLMFAKEKEEAIDKANSHYVYNYFYSLKR